LIWEKGRKEFFEERGERGRSDREGEGRGSAGF